MGGGVFGPGRAATSVELGVSPPRSVLNSPERMRLRASVEIQWSRLRVDRTRPLLQEPDPVGILTRLAAERDPLYRELCDHPVDMDEMVAHEVCDDIVAWLDQLSGLS